MPFYILYVKHGSSVAREELQGLNNTCIHYSPFRILEPHMIQGEPQGLSLKTIMYAPKKQKILYGSKR